MVELDQFGQLVSDLQAPKTGTIHFSLALHHTWCPKPAQAYPAILDFHVDYGTGCDFGALDIQAMYNMHALRT